MGETFDGIYDLRGKTYRDTESYMAEAEAGYADYVGILSHTTRMQDGDLAAERALKKALNDRGVGVIPAFSLGRQEEGNRGLTMEQAVLRFFVRDGKPLIRVLINFIAYGKTDAEGGSLFERAAEFYRRLNLPVVRPVMSSRLSRKQWQESRAPIASEAASCFDMAEMQGIIEPVFLGGKQEGKERWIVGERAEKTAERVCGWIGLQKKPACEKRLAVILNSAVCSGVEATLGRAVGLDAFESAVKLLKSLKDRGCDTGEDLPESGVKLRELFLRRKAYSDFRWTSAQDILSAGGVVYQMPVEEYLSWYRQMPAESAEKMEETWGAPPGEAMAIEGRILVTGLCFGKILLMVQPKRGCHGAKCTGEVCRILQDPSCPPSHQYMASYFYMTRVFGADALVHFGTHGSLEFLPGKANGLSGACYGDAAVGGRPNLYLFNAGCVSAAIQAKRRSYAVTVDHRFQDGGLHVLGQDEIGELLRGLEGGFILPGGGADAAGDWDRVKTGRNLYGVDLRRIPSREAYERGSAAAGEMLCGYLAKEGHYPEQIALSMIAADIPRTGGEQMSLFLHLLGVRPIWRENGTVEGMELIPLKELGRPRMDVNAHISGVLRDAWPDVAGRLDEAVRMAACAKEAPEDNFVVKIRAGKKLTAQTFTGSSAARRERMQTASASP